MNKMSEKIDKLIEYVCDVNGIPLEPLACVMCNELAFWIAFETKEPLCDRCRNNNAEARLKK